MGTAEMIALAVLSFSSAAVVPAGVRSARRVVAPRVFRDDFRRGMRIMAGLQFGAACLFALLGLWLRG